MSSNPLQDTFVFQPGGTNRRISEGIPIYTNFTHLWGEVLASTASQKTVILDDTASATISIPAGTYDFTGVQLVGRWSLRTTQKGYVLLSLPAGVTLDNLQVVEGIGILSHPAGGGVFRYNSATDFTVQYRRCYFTAAADTTLISLSGGTTLRLLLERTQFGNGFNMITMTASDILSIEAYQRSIVNDDLITGPVGATLADTAIEAGSSINTAQTNFAGSGTLIDNSAIRVKYIAGTPGNWATSAPTDLANAVDRLASAFNALHGPVT